jgi:TonB family protein
LAAPFHFTMTRINIPKTLTALVALLSLIHGNAVASNRGELTRAMMKALTVHAPKPEYPFDARQRGLTGTGIAVVDVDAASGLVTHAVMAPSTGHKVLDDAALSAFREWRFKPGTIHGAQIPVAFTMGDDSGAGTIQVVARYRSMDQLLVPFLGKGAVLNAPIPGYPALRPWGNKHGKGVYELHFGADGKATDVKILTGSGDPTFDRAAVDTLHEWRLRKGPKIIELPLAFSLTPEKYSVRIP